MKPKAEILKSIKKLRETRDSYAFMKQKAFRDICDGQIRSLRWVLGYKIGEWFWCVQCQRQHKGLKCPSCGNNVGILPLKQQK